MIEKIRIKDGWNKDSSRSKEKTNLEKMKFRTRVLENGKVVSKDAWIEKTNLEKFEEALHLEDEKYVLSKGCEAILQDDEEHNDKGDHMRYTLMIENIKRVIK